MMQPLFLLECLCMGLYVYIRKKHMPRAANVYCEDACHTVTRFHVFAGLLKTLPRPRNLWIAHSQLNVALNRNYFVICCVNLNFTFEFSTRHTADERLRA